jgi:hypothetical protein
VPTSDGRYPGTRPVEPSAAPSSGNDQSTTARRPRFNETRTLAPG